MFEICEMAFLLMAESRLMLLAHDNTGSLNQMLFQLEQNVILVVMFPQLIVNLANNELTECLTCYSFYGFASIDCSMIVVSLSFSRSWVDTHTLSVL